MKTEKAKHTPGPWEVCKVENSIGYEIRERDFGPLLANVFGANEKANARLIAAAPELLAALEQIMTMAKVEGVRGTSSAWYSFGEQTANVARAAIAKAKGE